MYRRTTAPDIDNAVGGGGYRWGSNRYGSDYNEKTFDDKTYALADLLFSLTEELEPRDPDGTRSLYLRAPRGEPEDYMSFRDWKYDCPKGKKKEYLEEWKWMYPDEYCWYRLTTYTFSKDGRTLKAIWLGGELIFQYDDSLKKTPWPDNDLSRTLCWAIDEVHEAMRAMKSGTYNETVRRDVPYSLRTGTIVRKRLWEVFPEQREGLVGTLSEEDLAEFDRYAREQDEEPPYFPDRRIHGMTSGDYLRWCALGYRAMGYKGSDLSPKEQYMKHADGRQQGLLDIDPGSPEEFDRWFHDSKYRDGHPWEVCAGGTWTHIALYVSDWGGDGYYLRLSGSCYGRTEETVKLYLALRREGLPVHLDDAGLIADRLSGDGIVGVVP